MTDFNITILGNNSAIPANGRHPSAQFLKIGNTSILVDCGEGTQLRLREVEGANLFHISHIFISHLHGDHFLGLVGLLSSLGLMRREKPLHLYGHADLLKVIDVQFAAMGVHEFNYELIFHELPLAGSQLICEEDGFKVEAFQLEHRIPTCGFRFEEKFAKKKVNKQALMDYNVPMEFWNSIQKGQDYQPSDGVLIKNEELTLPSPKPRTYVYCSDTVYTESFLPQIQNCDTVYIESTYLDELSHMAADRMHCTAKQAATLAKKGNIGRLLIGHFSSRYKELQPFLDEARSVFQKTELAEEGKTFTIELW